MSPAGGRSIFGCRCPADPAAAAPPSEHGKPSKRCLCVVAATATPVPATTEPRVRAPVSQVVFYGEHYAAFVFNAETRVWRYVDDANLRPVGTWQEVKELCERGAAAAANPPGILRCKRVRRSQLTLFQRAKVGSAGGERSVSDAEMSPLRVATFSFQGACSRRRSSMSFDWGTGAKRRLRVPDGDAAAPAWDGAGVNLPPASSRDPGGGWRGINELSSFCSGGRRSGFVATPPLAIETEVAAAPETRLRRRRREETRRRRR